METKGNFTRIQKMVEEIEKEFETVSKQKQSLDSRLGELRGMHSACINILNTWVNEAAEMAAEAPEPTEMEPEAPKQGGKKQPTKLG